MKILTPFLNSNKVKVIALLLVLFFTFILRAIHSDRMPFYGHLEEMMFAWSGLYMIEEGVPVSWSTLGYPKDRIVFHGQITDKYNHAKHDDVKLIKPWLDQPPLFSLIIGGSSHLFGADKEYLVPSSYIRFPMLFISLATSIILFLLARKLFGYWTALGSVFIWGTVPLFVFASRMAVPENAIAALLMLSLYLFLKYREKASTLLLIILILIPGLAGLMKPTGYFIAPLIAFLFFYKREFKQGITLLVGQLPLIVAFLIYGFALDPEAFRIVLDIQGTRPAGWNSLTYLISNPAFDISPFYDSWYIFAFIFTLFFLFASLGKVLPKNIKDFYQEEGAITFLVWAFLYWLLVVLFSGGEQDLLPWYRYPLFPLLAIFCALGIRYLFKFPSFFTLAIAAAFLIGNRIYLVNAFHPNTTAQIFRAEFILFVLPGLLYAIWQKEVYRRLIIVSLLIMIAWGSLINILVVKDYHALVCEAKTCPIGPPTFLTR